MIDYLTLRSACEMLTSVQIGSKVLTGKYPMWNENLFTEVIQARNPTLPLSKEEIQKTWFFLVNIKVLVIDNKYDFHYVDEARLHTTIETITRFSAN